METHPDQPQAHCSKAIVFTHFGHLQYGRNVAEWEEKEPGYEKQFTRILENYLLCARETHRLGAIYVYIDSSLKRLLLTTGSESAKDRIQLVDAVLLQRERQVKGFLRNLQRTITAGLGLQHDELVRIRYVGLEELLGLLNSLVAIDG